MIFESPLLVPVLAVAYIGGWFLFWYFARRGKTPDPAPIRPAGAEGDEPGPKASWWTGLLSMIQRDEAALAIGVLLPWLLILADPGIFAGNFFSMGSAFLGRYRTFAYVATACFTATLLVRLIRPLAPSFLAGFLGAGAVFALATGTVLLPISLVGIFFAGIGLLGLLPFFIAYVYFLRARQSWREACGRAGRDTVAVVAFLGCLMPVATACTAHVAVERRYRAAVDEVLSDDPELQQRGTETLRALRMFIDVYRLGDDYMLAAGEQRKARVATAFETLTGRDITFAVMD